MRLFVIILCLLIVFVVWGVIIAVCKAGDDETDEYILNNLRKNVGGLQEIDNNKKKKKDEDK